MKTCVSLFLAVLIAAGAFAAAPSVPSAPRDGNGSNPLDQQWGPDTFGYRALDSNEPGGPTAQWMDIESIGTQVTGLTDDNFVGPFPIGFNFHYYWYDVSQFWVGSNGYIKFQPVGQLAQTFPDFPTPTVPNDVIGPYVADWFFGGSDPSECYYWADNDTLIVMWKNVTAWASGGNLGNHNFEVILSTVDSSFTFQFGQSTTGDVSANDIHVGFENQTGQIGLQMYDMAYPPSNYAIKIAYPDTITYTVHDMAVAGVQTDGSRGIFLLTNDTLMPWLAIRNAGNQSETSYLAQFSIRQVSNNSLQASDDTTMGATVPSQLDEIIFPPLWTPAATGLFRAIGRVTLASDINHGNDSVRTEIHVMNVPGEMFYDDNTMDRDWGWSGGNGGMANEFIPPVYPVEVTQVRVYVSTTAAGGFSAQVIDDDGPNGTPSTILFEQAVPNPSGAAWATVTVDPPVVITEGKFYVAWYQTVEGIFFGIDTTSAQGIARRSWEYTGGWAENRLSQEGDPMIRATIDFAGNHAPVITQYSPTTLDSVEQGATVTFFIIASDADGDPLDYLWTLNGSPVGTNNPSANITFTQLGVNHVLATVTDGIDVDSVSWSPTVYEGNAADDPGLALPVQFALHTAYPNPFNPATLISYDVARGTNVAVRVYNLAGELVTTLVDSRMEPGRYQVEWNAATQPSGTYFVTFDAADVHQVQKLLLLK